PHALRVWTSRMTVLESIQRSTDFLTRKGVESPRLQAELLLAHVLALPRMRLYLNFERTLSQPEVEALRELVLRRSRREPLQHILGTSSFCGLELGVNRHVLVPRPETELLAEAGWAYLNGLPATSLNGRPPCALDYGTGSGCVALALASKCPTAEIHALDISSEALDTAKQNATGLGLGERIRFWQGDGLRVLPPGVRFDLIISNPPYIPSAEIATLEPEVREFDPRQALDGGPDGLDHYRRLASHAGAYLQSTGRLMLEFGDGQADSIRLLLEEQNWVVEKISEDYTRRPRIMIARKTADFLKEPRADAPATGRL
ncbi:MAG TPA: peptide chain release factor N(5)-glutamine methyltransferase, partial [Verrucomicrobiae bacterium]|nr:peptide chain release factor N(5)-glutamine methyltransferase [Verrucomicrobiae bacterium]